MADTLRYFTEFGKPALQKTICGGIYARVYCIFSACTTSLQRMFTFAISSPDEFLVMHLFAKRPRIRVACKQGSRFWTWIRSTAIIQMKAIGLIVGTTEPAVSSSQQCVEIGTTSCGIGCILNCADVSLRRIIAPRAGARHLANGRREWCQLATRGCHGWRWYPVIVVVVSTLGWFSETYSNDVTLE